MPPACPAPTELRGRPPGTLPCIGCSTVGGRFADHRVLRPACKMVYRTGSYRRSRLAKPAGRDGPCCSTVSSSTRIMAEIPDPEISAKATVVAGAFGVCVCVCVCGVQQRALFLCLLQLLLVPKFTIICSIGCQGEVMPLRPLYVAPCEPFCEEAAVDLE